MDSGCKHNKGQNEINAFFLHELFGKNNVTCYSLSFAQTTVLFYLLISIGWLEDLIRIVSLEGFLKGTFIAALPLIFPCFRKGKGKMNALMSKCHILRHV